MYGKGGLRLSACLPSSQAEESEFLVFLHHRIGYFKGCRDIRSSEGRWRIIKGRGVNRLTYDLKTLDAYVEGRMSLAFSKKTRREFMSGKDARFSSKFWMQTPMFLPASGMRKAPPPAHVHPWVANADRASYAYRANPRPPTVYGRRDGAAVPIRECDPPSLCAGDVVSITFTVTYQFTDKDWYPLYQPVEVYVLKRSTYAELSEYEAPRAERVRPATMDVSVVEGT